MRDKLFLIGFLALAGLLLFLGRNLLPQSVLVTWAIAFGGTTAVSVLIASLYRVQLELRASRHELARKEAELSFAREVQQALFPRQMPGAGGLEFSAVCLPARGISGDYYDVLQLPDGRLIFAIADISGKGISAAILMANLQALLRAMAESGLSPAEVCARLNRHLHQVTDSNKFATFFYAEWNPAELRLRYVNAGHNVPLLYGSRGGEQLDKGGFPLGMFPAVDFETGELPLQPGDLLVLYSDGITEATSNGGQEFGELQLKQLIASHCEAPLADLQRHVLQRVRDWANHEPDDDMTLLLVRAVPAMTETA